jgi:hypothetical protein
MLSTVTVIAAACFSFAACGEEEEKRGHLALRQRACALCTPSLPVNATGLCKELIPGWSTNNVMDGK